MNSRLTVTSLLFSSLFLCLVDTTYAVSPMQAKVLHSQLSNSLPRSLLAQKQITAEDEKYKLKIDLQGCKRDRQNVSCYLLFTNVGEKDLELLLSSNAIGNGWRSSRIVDSAGDEYVAKATKIGNVVENGGVGRLRLVRNVLTKASISFQIPEQVVDIALLEVVYGGGASPIGESQFRQATIVTVNEKVKPPQKKK